MERLTERRGEATWRLFHVLWYINFGAAIIALFWAGYLWHSAIDFGAVISALVLASVLLVASGITRYQARLEGQHLELKLTINEVLEKLDGAGKTEEPSE
jgi:hypothetical protein